MNFISDFKNSFYNPQFYASLRARKFSSSFKYFFALIGALTFIQAFVIGSEASAFFSSSNLYRVVGFYPKELVLTLQGGAVSTNVTEPYLIKNSESKRNEPANLVVIDTKNDFSLDLYKQYNARIFLGKNFLAIEKGPGRFDLSDLSHVPDFTLGQGRLFHYADVVVKHHLLISFAIFASMFVFIFAGMSVGFLAVLLLFAPLIMFFAKRKKISLSYCQSYQFGLHALTLPLILQTVFMLGGFQSPMPFFSVIVFLVVVLCNLRKSEFELLSTDAS